MKDTKMVFRAIICFTVVVSLILPGAVAGASSVAAQPPEDRVNAHSAMGGFSYRDCLLPQLSENYEMSSGLADSPWLEFRQNLQGTGGCPSSCREMSDNTDQYATVTANNGEVRTDGFWLDRITITREPDRPTAVSRLQTCEYDVYAHTLDDLALFDIVDDDPNLWYKSSIGSFNTLRINPYGPEFTTGMVNPFHLFDFPDGVRTMNEVLNKFVDREFIANDIMGGLAWPRFTSQHTQLSDYDRYYDGTFIDPAASISTLEGIYEYDPVTGMAWLEATMAAISDLAPGTITGSAATGWLYNGDPIPMTVLIRQDDPIRDQIGDYIVSQLQTMGFDASPFKGDMAATLSGFANVSDKIAGGEWAIYTGGWVSTVLSRDSGYWFIYFHSNLWAGGIPAFAHLDVPDDFFDAAFDLGWLSFSSFEERDDLYEFCLPRHMKWGMFYLVDSRGFSPLKKNVNLAADRAGGIYGSWMWALTAHFRDTADNPQFGGHMRVAMHDLLVEPWNPIAGSNTIYDMFPIRATGDMGHYPDLNTGLRWAARIDSAEVVLQTGLPAIATNPWVTLNFADTITAPADAWRAWDWETQSVVTVADALANPDAEWGLEPDGEQVYRYSAAYYPEDIWGHPLHCGSTLSYADFLYGWIIGYDRAQGEGVNPMFDAAAKAAIGRTYADTIGVKFTVGGPADDFGLLVETWSKRWEMDAERMVSDWYPNYAQGNGFWHAIALGVRGERAGDMAFGEAKAQHTAFGWISFLNRHVQQEALVGYLDGIRAATTYTDANMPYFEFIDAQYGTSGLGSFAAEVDLRMDNLKDFIDEKNHMWVGSGPYYLEDYSFALKWIRLAAFEDYPDPADRWLFLLPEPEPEEDWLVNLSLTTDPDIGGVPGPGFAFAVGARDGATEGYNEAEGDQVAPPDPMTGVNAYLYYPDNPMYQRNLVTSVVGPGPSITWRLLVKSVGDPGATEATLTWDVGDVGSVPDKYGVLELRDSAGSTLANMRLQDSYTFTLLSSETKTFHIVAAEQVCLAYDFKAGWNMMSLPVHTEETSPGELFPGHVAIYSWDAEALTYYVPEELSPGRGYWVLYFTDTTVTVCGIPVQEYELADAVAGWHLIGSLWTDAQVSVTEGSIYSMFYWWNPDALSYEATDTLAPGKGYWLLGFMPFSIEVESRQQAIYLPDENL